MVQRLKFVSRILLTVATVIIFGFLGLSLVFSDLGPNETPIFRASLTVIYYFLSGVLIGITVYPRWKAASFVAWGTTILAVVSLFSNLSHGAFLDTLFSLILLIMPIAISLAGGYIGMRLFKLIQPYLEKFIRKFDTLLRNSGRRVVVILFAAIVLINIAIYIFYIRGAIVNPKLTGPKTVTVGENVKVYQWEARAQMPTPRSEIAGVVLGENIYIIGGFDDLGRTSLVVEMYDTQKDEWIRVSDLPQARHHTTAVEVDGKIYVIGGFEGGFDPKSEVFVYDPQTNSWSQKTSMPTARGGLASAVIDNKVYVVGGIGQEGLTNVLEVYDPSSDTWEQKSSATIKRDHLAASSLDGLLLVGGGREQHLTANLNILEIYDPQTNSWRQGPPLPTARGGIAGSSFDEMFVVVGGESPTGTFSQVEGYHLKSEQWISLPNLPTARHGLAAVTVGNKLYVIGGGKFPGLSVSGNNEVLTIR